MVISVVYLQYSWWHHFEQWPHKKKDGNMENGDSNHRWIPMEKNEALLCGKVYFWHKYGTYMAQIWHKYIDLVWWDVIIGLLRVHDHPFEHKAPCYRILHGAATTPSLGAASAWIGWNQQNHDSNVFGFGDLAKKRSPVYYQYTIGISDSWLSWSCRFPDFSSGNFNVWAQMAARHCWRWKVTATKGNHRWPSICRPSQSSIEVSNEWINGIS